MNRGLAFPVAAVAGLAGYATWNYNQYRHFDPEILISGFTGDPRPDAEAASIWLMDVKAIAANDAPHSQQGCFAATTAQSGPDGEFNLDPATLTVPEVPIWLRCFDRDQLVQDIEIGAVTAYVFPVQSPDGAELRLYVLDHPLSDRGGVFWTVPPEGRSS